MQRIGRGDFGGHHLGSSGDASNFAFDTVDISLSLFTTVSGYHRYPQLLPAPFGALRY
jgi:hypothetical protein